MAKTVFKTLAGIGLMAFALAACSGGEPAEQPAEVGLAFAHESSDLPVHPDVRYGQLENGMRYAILANATPEDTAAMRLVFNVGSLAESDDQRGLAHFIEHMAFNGTTNVPEGEMVPLLERYGLAFGPDTNAFTGYETVGYQLDLPENDDATIDTALFLLRETASEMLFDPAAIDRERGVILSEDRVRNSPLRRWSVALQRFRYPGTLITERDPIGVPAIIETATRDQFVDYYENFYVPQRALLVVTGDVDVDDMEGRVSERFADWQGPETLRPDPEIGEINPARPFSVGYLHDPEVYTILTVDALRPLEERADMVETRFENNLASIGNAILSRRFETMISAGTSPLLEAQAAHGPDFGVAERAGILAVLAPERWEDGVAIVEQELRRALTFGFTQAELDEQVANQYAAMRAAAERADTQDTRQLADQLWEAWREGQVFTTPQSTLARYEAGMERITVEAVEAAFRARWDGVEPIIFLATSLEMSEPENALKALWEASAEVALEAPLELEQARFEYTDFGTPGAVASREEIDDLDLVRLRFENGVQLSFKETDFDTGRVLVRVNFGAGELEPRIKPTVDTLTSYIFLASGLGDISYDDLGRALAGRNVQLDFSIGESRFGFQGASTQEDFLTQMQLFAAYLTDPGWREEGLARFQAIAPELRRNLRSSPSGILQSDVARLLRSGDQRYGFPTEEEAAAITLADIEAFLSPALEAAPIEITVVGDLSEAQAVEAVAATFGALPPRAQSWSDYPEARTIRFPDAQAEPLVFTHNGPPEQAMVNIYWPTADGEDTRQRRALRLLRGVFDLKLTERLREQEGFTYSAFASEQASRTYPDFGYLWVGVDVARENVAQTYAVVDELAAGLAAGDISEDELLRARRPIMESIEEAQGDSNASWMAWLAGSFREPSRLDDIRTLESDYSGISREELIALARDYLVSENSLRVTILPVSAEADTNQEVNP